MKWKQAEINGVIQPLGIQSVGHDYRIGKFTVDDGALCTIYGLWRGHDLLGYFPDSAEAKDAAERDLNLLPLPRTSAGDGRTRPAATPLHQDRGGG